MSKLTEKALMWALTELLEEKPMSKITIKEITDRCGLTRNTFYYHYHDIYELIAKYFADEASRLLERYIDDQDWEGGFLEGLNFLYENSKIIRHIYVSVSRPEVDRYVNEIVYNHALTIIKKEASKKEYSEETIALVADFYKNAVVGAVMSWIERGMKEKPEELATLYNGLFTGTLYNALESVEQVFVQK